MHHKQLYAFCAMPHHKNLHLHDSRSYTKSRLSLDEDYDLGQPPSWNSTIIFHLIILTIMKYKRKIYWEDQKLNT